MNLKNELIKVIGLLNSRQISDAELTLKKILDKHPKNPDALTFLGIIHIEKGLIVEGVDLIKRSLSLHPAQPLALLNCSIGLYQMNAIEDSLSYCNQAIRYNPKNPEALFQKGLLLTKIGKSDDAINFYKEAIEINPQYYEALINLAELYKKINDDVNAILCLERALQVNSNNLQIQQLIADLELRNNNFKRAFYYLNSLLTSDPTNEINLLNIGLCFLKLNKLDEALNIFSTLIMKNKLNILALNNRATVFFLLKKYQEGIYDAKEAINVNPNFIDAYITYSNLLKESGKLDEAINQLNLVIKLSPDNLDAVEKRGGIFFMQKKYDEALRDLNFVIATNPDFAEAYSDRGCVYRDLRFFEKALSDFNKALEINPTLHIAISNRAVLYATKRDFTNASNDFQFAIKLNEDDHPLKYSYAGFLLAYKRFDLAWNFFESRLFFWQKPMQANNVNIPVWIGPNELGKVLIIGEQGIGDQIFYGSLLSELLLLKGTNFIVLLDQRLVSLFKKSFKEIEFFSFEDFNLERLPLDKKIDSYLYIGSLPGFFRKSIDSFKNQKKSFLISESYKDAELISAHKKNKKICGISWRSQNNKVGCYKSLELSNFKEILSKSNLEIINLQYGDVREEISNFNNLEKVNIKELDIDNFNDIEGLASIIQSCDFVITCSNVTAHIAGALGKETFLLVPYSDGRVWYWHEGDHKSMWYPSIRIFRQTLLDSWEEPLRKLKDDLENLYGLTD